jgi:hypothetical protein
MPINNIHKNFCMNEYTTVRVLEQLFLEQFGILAHVLRKSGNSWLETTKTEDWTLKRQNDEGKELSQFTH